MTQKKIMPQTLLNLNLNPLIQNIMDRSMDLNSTIEKVKKLWSFDMYTRTPSQTLDGGTNLDVACVFYSLAERSANIKIPNYKSLRPTSDKSKLNEIRSGDIVSISSNKDLFSFSVKIFDESVNDYRNFCITDPRGNFYLKQFSWEPTKEEKEYLVENQVSFDNQISFKNFVHPNRWTSFYGQNYFITKALIQRIGDECKDIFSQIKAMQKEGITYPSDTTAADSKAWPKKEKADGKAVIFKSLEVEVDFPMINKFTKHKFSQDDLVILTDLRKHYIYSIQPVLRFATRCTELAFFKYANDKMPSWLGGGVKWETGFKLPRKKIMWDRLKIVQPEVGQFSLAIRKRIREKSEIMAIDFETNGLIS